MEIKNNNRGGARKGAGRKIEGESKKTKRFLGIKVSPEEYDFLDSKLNKYSNENKITKSDAIRKIISSL